MLYNLHDHLKHKMLEYKKLLHSKITKENLPKNKKLTTTNKLFSKRKTQMSTWRPLRILNDSEKSNGIFPVGALPNCLIFDCLNRANF